MRVAVGAVDESILLRIRLARRWRRHERDRQMTNWQEDWLVSAEVEFKEESQYDLDERTRVPTLPNCVTSTIIRSANTWRTTSVGTDSTSSLV